MLCLFERWEGWKSVNWQPGLWGNFLLIDETKHNTKLSSHSSACFNFAPHVCVFPASGIFSYLVNFIVSQIYILLSSSFSPLRSRRQRSVPATRPRQLLSLPTTSFTTFGTIPVAWPLSSPSLTDDLSKDLIEIQYYRSMVLTFWLPQSISTSM